MMGTHPILVVEDDPDILSTIVSILEFEGYPVEQARNGEEGLKILEQVRPALVLLDMRMPVVDGWSFARIMKEKGIALPILVMTAAQDARRWAQEIGAAGFISKPFDLNELLNAVAHYKLANGNSPS
jgi:CheY-like chemotaxis protein